MSKNYSVSAQRREKAGKGASRALRRENQIPAVIYGDGKEPVRISMQAKTANLEYNKGHMFTTLCDVDLEGDSHLVLARDVQVHPVSGNVLHIDFLRVTPKTKIKVMVPVHFANMEKSPAAQEKGILNVVRHEVEMACQATAIPDALDVDMSEVNIGDILKISHAVLPEGAIPVIDDRDFTLATIMAPRKIVEVEATEEAEGEEAAEGSAEGGEAPAAGESAEKDAPAAAADA